MVCRLLVFIWSFRLALTCGQEQIDIRRFDVFTQLVDDVRPVRAQMGTSRLMGLSSTFN